jgi:glycosyltransferase involved in cell wall biosynthesis
MEIIAVDGGSTDGSQEKKEDTHVTLIQSKKGRAIQMNAKAATGNILYFTL